MTPASTPNAAPEGVGLTNAQRMLWASQQLHPGDALYNMAFLFTIDGAIDVDAFVRAHDRLVAESDALRTVIDTSDGAPVGRVRDPWDDSVAVIDLSGEADPDAAARRWADARCAEALPIDDRTFDAALLLLGGGRSAWYLNQHHVVSDAWTFTVLYRRMETLYRAALANEPWPDGALPAFADVAATLVADQPPPQSPSASPLRLYGRRHEDLSTDNRRTRLEIEGQRAETLAAVAARPGVRALTPDLTTFELMATAAVAYLSRVSGQNTITLGIPVHNRTTPVARATAGLFMEVYPLTVEVPDGASFADLHAVVRQATLDLMRSATPGAAPSNRDISIVLNVIRAEFPVFAGNPVTAEWLHSGHVEAHHQLRIQVHDFAGSGDLTIDFDANKETFDHGLRTAMPQHLGAILDALDEHWDDPIASVPLTTPEQARNLAVLGTGRASQHDSEATVVDWIQAHVAARPESVALIDGGLTWTYADLDDAVRRFAGSVEAGSVVGIALGRSAQAVAAMLGTVMAGAAYVPIDPSWPASRIDFVVGDAGCSVVVGDIELPGHLVRRFDEMTAGEERDDLPDVSAESTAYVLYTSGSTGNPKGVRVTHRSLANYTGWARSFYDRGDRVTFPLFSQLTFDLTVTSVFVPLISGGSIVVYDEDDGPVDLTIRRVFEDDVVDIVKLTPSHLALVQDLDLSSSRICQLILGGEDLTTQLARRTHVRFGGAVEIHNEYGPTEATVGCVVHTYDPDTDLDASVPIGRPIDGMAAHILDAGRHHVPLGVVGELWVAGASVAAGYVGRDDLTAERFVDDPALGRMYATGDLARMRAEGTIEYLGRSDDQVKIRGARIELGEVEAAVAAHPDIEGAAAIVWQRDLDAVDDRDLVHCSRCGLASNFPGISYDADLVCNQCRALETYEDRARVYFKPEHELAAVFEQASADRTSDYDCISLLSGGKDSTYVLARLVDMGLRPLAFTLDNGYISEQAKANIRRVTAELGVDHVFATTPAMNEIFVDSLERHANVCQGCFKTIYTLAVETALEHDIPLIVTGLSRGQFFETRLTEDLFTEMTVSSDLIDANVLEARKAYHQVDDAVKRLLDTSMFDDPDVFEKVRFVDFYRYIDVGLDELYAYLDERVPWVRPTDTGRSTNCLINDVGIWYHRRTRGFHNYALPYSWDVRMGHKTRGEALEELDDDIDVDEVRRILAEIGYPEDIAELESGRKLVSYYAAPVEIPVPALRDFVADSLPEQMVPVQYVRVDAIPLTSNGKIDRAALPRPDVARPEVDVVYVAPGTDTQVALARVWEDVIGVNGIGIRDNYFDIGGDSIMAIQIVARAHRVGFPITLHDLFDALTIEALADVADAARADAADRVVGRTGLLPIQHWWLDGSGPVDDFHQVVEVSLPDELDRDALASALGYLVDHHDALRQTFERSDDGWVSSVVDAAPPPTILDLAQADRGGLVAPYDLTEAPLVRAGITSGPDPTLVLAAHHLVVDAVSWMHLLDDLAQLYEAAVSGSTLGLPAVSTSIRDWADHLEASVDPAAVESWQAVVDRAVASVPAPSPPLATGVVSLDPDRTARLSDAAARFHAGVDELFATAVAQVLADEGTGALRIFVEGHGRDSDDPTMDVTRTVGWFTSLYPVVIEFGGSDTDNHVAAVRDALRAAAPVGREYGILRQLQGDDGSDDTPRVDETNHVVVNYLGRIGAAPGVANAFTMVRPLELVRGDETGSRFAAEVSAALVGDHLEVTWTGGADTDPAALAADVVAGLADLVDAPTSAPASGGIADLDDSVLGKLAAALGSTDEPAGGA